MQQLPPGEIQQEADVSIQMTGVLQSDHNGTTAEQVTPGLTGNAVDWENFVELSSVSFTVIKFHVNNEEDIQV